MSYISSNRFQIFYKHTTLCWFPASIAAFERHQNTTTSSTYAVHCQFRNLNNEPTTFKGMSKLSNVCVKRAEKIKIWRGNNHGRRSVTLPVSSSLPSALRVNRWKETKCVTLDMSRTIHTRVQHAWLAPVPLKTTFIFCPKPSLYFSLS